MQSWPVKPLFTLNFKKPRARLTLLDGFQTEERQIRNLRANTLECFAETSFDFADRSSTYNTEVSNASFKKKNEIIETRRNVPKLFDFFPVPSVRCFERRRRCLERMGWCYTKSWNWGFCNPVHQLTSNAQ